jgi:hypothetical protein
VTLNGFDQYGHFARGAVRLTNCLDYEFTADGESGCISNFNGPNAPASASISSAELYALIQEELSKQTGGTGFDPSAPINPRSSPAPDLGQGQQLGGGATRAAPPPAPQRALLDYLLGP